MVWDAGGRYVLDTLWPEKWPNLKRLIPKTIWYENATAGSTPSNTAPIHANIGTGAFPYRHGMVDKYARFPDGSVVQPWTRGPGALLEPTFADHYGYEAGDRAVMGLVGTLTGHMGMLGRGSLVSPSYRPIAVLRERGTGAEVQSWILPDELAPYYRFPSYVNDLPGLDRYTPALDRADGAVDGKWRDNSIAQYEGGWATPARIPYQTRMVEEVIKREGFGQDDVPDLLFINSKAIDHVSHIWSVNSPEMEDTLRYQDRDLTTFIRFLDQQVGRGNYVLVVTADHGAQFDPKVSGAFQVTPGQLEADLNAAFPSSTKDSVFLAVRTSQIYLNEDALRASGYSEADIARFVLNYTKEQGASDPTTVPSDQLQDHVMSMALPIDLLDRLPCLPEARAS
jgi:hypothetical protein